MDIETFKRLRPFVYTRNIDLVEQLNATQLDYLAKATGETVKYDYDIIRFLIDGHENYTIENFLKYLSYDKMVDLSTKLPTAEEVCFLKTQLSKQSIPTISYSIIQNYLSLTNITKLDGKIAGLLCSLAPHSIVTALLMLLNYIIISDTDTNWKHVSTAIHNCNAYNMSCHYFLSVDTEYHMQLETLNHCDYVYECADILMSRLGKLPSLEEVEQLAMENHNYQELVRVTGYKKCLHTMYFWYTHNKTTADTYLGLNLSKEEYGNLLTYEINEYLPTVLTELRNGKCTFMYHDKLIRDLGKDALPYFKDNELEGKLADVYAKLLKEKEWRSLSEYAESKGCN